MRSKGPPRSSANKLSANLPSQARLQYDFQDMRRSIRGLLGLAGLLMIVGGCSSNPGPVVCQEGSQLVGGVCRVSCSEPTECLLSERCEAGVCAPSNPEDGPFFGLFEADEELLLAPDEVTLRYAVFHADSIEIHREDELTSPGEPEVQSAPIGVGETRFFIPRTSTFTLVAVKGGDRSFGPTVTVEVEEMPMPIDLSLVAMPTRIEPGQNAVLQWEVSEAEQVRLEEVGGGTVLDDAMLSGTRVVSPQQTTTYELVAVKEGVHRARVTVFVNDETAPVMLNVFAPDQVVEGMPALISWSTQNADSLSIFKGSGELLFRTVRPGVVQDGEWLVQPDFANFNFIVEVQRAGEPKEEQVLFNIEPLVQPPYFLDTMSSPNVLYREKPTEVFFSWSHDQVDVNADVLLFQTPNPGGSPFPLSGNSHSTTLDPNTPSFFQLVVENVSSRPAYKGGGIDVVDHQVMFKRQESMDGMGGPIVLNFQAVQGVLDVSDLLGDRYDVDVPADGKLDVTFEDTICAPGMLVSLKTPTGQLIQGAVTGAGGCPELSTSEMFGDAAPGGLYRVEIGWSISAPLNEPVEYLMVPKVHLPVCGDGLLTEAFEGCDDGNRMQGDGCGPACQVEPEFNYSAEPAMSFDTNQSGRIHPIFTYRDGMPNNQDLGAAIVPLPFGFTFFGRPYEAVLVHRDGFLSFLADYTDPNFDPVRARWETAPNAMIAVFRADLVGGEVRSWETTDALFLSFEGMGLKGVPNSTLSAVVQLKADYSITVSYTEVQVPPGINQTFEVGLEGPFGRFGVAPDMCSSFDPERETGLCRAEQLTNLEAIRYR